jgi:glycosyltransferase involved in cell wall biosynthesis
MTGRPTISVVIHVFNCEKFLAAAVESVLAQTLPATEILVIDDGSTDGTAAIAKSFASPVHYEWREHAGVPAVRNHAIAVASGEWFAFLDADDLWTPDKLEVQFDFMLRRPELLFTMTHAKFFLEPGCVIPPGFRPQWFESDQIGSLFSSFLARKKVFDIVGGFDPALDPSDDVDWLARAKDLRVPMAFLDETLLLRRVHGSNVTGVPRNGNSLLQVVKRTLDRQRNA